MPLRNTIFIHQTKCTISCVRTCRSGTISVWLRWISAGGRRRQPHTHKLMDVFRGKKSPYNVGSSFHNKSAMTASKRYWFETVSVTQMHTYTKFTIIFMLHLQLATYVCELASTIGNLADHQCVACVRNGLLRVLYSTFWFIRQCDVLQFRNFDVFTRLIVCTWFSIKI